MPETPTLIFDPTYFFSTKSLAFYSTATRRNAVFVLLRQMLDSGAGPSGPDGYCNNGVPGSNFAPNLMRYTL